ncbi:MAG: c-type cytochrome [Alphaproteobacteria bacterium]
MKKKTTITAIAIALTFPLAAEAADANRGRVIARQWCASCHIVEPGQPAAADTAPAFATVANDPARLPSAQRAWLSNPHPPMPNLALSRGEIDDIVAYLESLRRP